MGQRTKKSSASPPSESASTSPLSILKRSPLIDVLFAFALGLLAFVVVVATAADVGLTYDEPVYASQAFRVRSWIVEVVTRMSQGDILAVADSSLIEMYWKSKDMQPSLLKIAIAMVDPIASPILGDLTGSRAATALFFAVLIATTYAFGAVSTSRLTGAAGALTLFFLPHVFAHAHLMSLDIPVVSMTLVTTFLFYIAVVTERVRWFVAAGIALGLALETKMNAVLILPSVITWILCRGIAVRANLPKVGMSAVIGVVVFYALWPYLWLHPWSHLIEYIRFHFQHYPVHVSYMGKIYDYAPWHYPIVMIAITTPIVLLCLWFAGAVRAARLLVDNRGGGGLWLSSALFQIVAFAYPHTPKYNGVRLFLAVFPFLCLLGGLALDRLSSILGDRAIRLDGLRSVGHLRAKLSGMLLLAAVIPGLYDTLDCHPFGMSFYNAAIGGVRGAVRRGFEPTYWGDAFLPLIPYLNDHARENALVLVIPGSASWFIEFYQNSGFLRPDIRLTGDETADYDWVIFHCRQSEMTSLARTLLAHARPALAVRYCGVNLACAVVRWEVDHVRRRQGIGSNAPTP